VRHAAVYGARSSVIMHVTHGGTYQKTANFTVKNVTNSNLNSTKKKNPTNYIANWNCDCDIGMPHCSLQGCYVESLGRQAQNFRTHLLRFYGRTLAYYGEPSLSYNERNAYTICLCSLWIKPTDALSSNFYWCYDSTCFGQSFCPSSGVPSRSLVALSHKTAKIVPMLVYG
jgi:hypothetical protein